MPLCLNLVQNQPQQPNSESIYYVHINEGPNSVTPMRLRPNSIDPIILLGVILCNVH